MKGEAIRFLRSNTHNLPQAQQAQQAKAQQTIQMPTALSRKVELAAMSFWAARHHLTLSSIKYGIFDLDNSSLNSVVVRNALRTWQ